MSAETETTESGVLESWLCCAADRKLVVAASPAALTAYEVRQFAGARLGADPPSLTVERLPLGERYRGEATVVELRWAGSDFSHGGSKDGRRLQEWSQSEEEWVDA